MPQQQMMPPTGLTKERLLAYLGAAEDPNAVAVPGPPAAVATPQAVMQQAASIPPQSPKQQTVQSVQTKTAEPAPENDLQALMAKMNERELGSLKEQGLTIEALKKQLGQAQQDDVPLDLTPLAALTDSWTGSNFAASYRPPETQKDRKAQIERLQGAIAQGGNNLSENEISLLRSQLNNAFQIKNLEASETQRGFDNKMKRDELQMKRDALAQSGGEKLTEAQKVIDRKFGETYSNDVVSGNFASSLNQVDNLKKLQAKLASGELGHISGPEIGLQPMVTRKLTYPESVAAQQSIEAAVQSSMKATLGSQFTKTEGENVLKRTFDPSLPPAENARRLKVVTDNLERAAKAKNAAFKHYEQNGTLKDFKGSADVEGGFLQGINEGISSSGDAKSRSELEAEARALGVK